MNSPAFFTRSRVVAAPMVGSARRKENSTAVFLSRPVRRPPIMVLAEREVPGITASVWIMPIMKAFL